MSVPGWIWPTLVTVVAFGAVYIGWPQSRGPYDFAPLVGCGYLLGAACVSLTAWLAWSLAA